MKTETIKTKQVKHVCSMPNLPSPLRVYVGCRKDGIRPTPEFAKKGLCDYSFNVGIICGHACLYCSARASLRTMDTFKEMGSTAFQRGFAIIDPASSERIRKGAHRLTAEDTVQLCTLDDAWSPESREFDIGRKCLEFLVNETPAKVRILTKSHYVIEDLDVVPDSEKHRIFIGLSTGIPACREDVASVVEPNASSIAERLAAMKVAHERGFQTFGMLCPCLPLVSDTPEALGEMFDAVLACGVEDVWLENMNLRGPNIHVMRNALFAAGLDREAEALSPMIGNGTKKAISRYAVNLVENAVAVAKEKGIVDKLHVLLYRKALAPDDRQRLVGYGPEIVWL